MRRDPQVKACRRVRGVIVLSLLLPSPLALAGQQAPVSAPAVATSAATAPAAPWETAFMSGSPSKLIAAASAFQAPPGSPVLMLNEELVCTYDQKGSRSERYRRVYKILDENGRQGWGSVGAAWSPWHQAKPEIHARVVTAAGQAFTLDPSTIEVSGSHADAEADVYSDRQLLRAPLPGVAVGSVVEIETVMQDSAPFFAAGTVERFFFGGSTPTRHTHLRLDAPLNLPLTYVAGTIPGLRKSETTIAGRRVVDLEAGPLAPWPDLWPGQSPESYLTSYVAFSTGASWSAVAKAYAELIDRQIGKPDLKNFLREAAPGVDPRRDRETFIARLVAHLGAEIKYTGVEFGDASIIPRTPAEIFARRYGDCKDKALLLTALLRSAGISAQVALLEVGFRPDVDAGLPGLGPFNHAIVFIPGAKPLWVDPTDRFSALGQLPRDDQDRLALIVSPATTGLVRTPLAPPSANKVIEARQVTVAENGDLGIVEHTDITGALGGNLRSGYAHADPKAIARQLEAHVKGNYQAKTLGKWAHSDVYAVDRPFHIDVETADAKAATVTDDAMAVTLPISSLIEFLPEQFRTNGASRARQGPEEPRSADYVLRDPFVYELSYHVTPPHGFVLDTPPRDEAQALGPARFSARFHAEKTGGVSAVFTFDTGKGRFTPAELETFSEAMKKFIESPNPMVTFHQVAAAALKAGNVREALAETRRLDQDHPGTALHTSQLASIYLGAGLGSAARTEARRAVALDPRSARAQRILGWVMEHDLVGRRFAAGCDRGAAERAYRRALELAPDDDIARASLIILQEYDSEGVLAFRPPHLDEVLALHRKFRETSKNPDGLLINYLYDLLNAERFADVLAERSSATGPVDARALRVAALAALSGPQAALQEASRLVPDSAQLPHALLVASSALLGLRRYPAAAGLLAQAAANGGDERTRSMVDRVRATHRREELRLDERKPGDVAKLFMAASMDLMSDVPGAFDRLRALSVPALAQAFERAGPATTRGQVRQGFGASLKNPAVPVRAIGDVVASTNVTVEGHPGDVCRVSFPMLAEQGKPEIIWFVAPDAKQHYKVVALSSDLSSLGSEALRLIQAGDLAGARKLLNAAAIGVSMGTADEPLSGAPLARIWQKGASAGDARQARAAAAALLVTDTVRAADAIPALEDCVQHPLSDTVALGCRVALLSAYGLSDRLDDAATVAARLESDFPESKAAFNLRVHLLNGVHRGGEALALVKARLARDPDDLDARRRLGEVQASVGDLRHAETTVEALTATNGAGATDFNLLAWLRLLRGKTDDQTVSLARRAAEASQRRSPTILHTLAAALAEADRPEEAYQTLREELDNRLTVLHPEITTEEWYVVGRIAESYGALDAAREAYGRCQRPKAPSAEDTWNLVERRVKALPPATPSAPSATRAH